MRRRKLAETSPPTLTSREVAEVFLGALTSSNLQYLDEQQYLRPTYYFDKTRPGGVISAPERDLHLENVGTSRGNARRRFTYGDLVWIQLLVYVRDRLETAKAARPLQKAGDIVRRLKVKTPEGCPPPSRLVFFGQDVYLLEESTVVSLTDGQLGLTLILTDTVEAEVKGRIDALVALERIRPIPTKCSLERSEVERASA
jgi:hypothetical protein